MKNANFYVHGLKPSYPSWENQTQTITGAQRGTFGRVFRRRLRTLQELRTIMGHDGRVVDVFKIDCEGCEWKTYLDWLQIDMRQLLIEFHDVPGAGNEIMQHLHDEGYVIFHKEANAEFAGGNCVEYSMLRLSKNFTNGH